MSLSTLKPRTMTRPSGPTPADIVGPIEKVVLDAQGAYKGYSDSGWKLGRLILTDKRFIFVVNDMIKVQVPLDKVIKVEMERQPFVLASTATVRLSWGKQGSRCPRRLYLVTKKIEVWRNAMFQTACLEVTDQTIERIASALDEDSGTLLWYVWHQHHAGIGELAEVIGAASHDDVLAKIRGRINPAAAKLLGCDILVFRHRWRATGSAEPITFHWWIAGKRKCAPAAPTVPVDVFEESDHIDVVTDLPGVRDSDVVLNVCNDRLVISAASDTQKLHKETRLPAGTHAETMTWRMNNGVLVARFRRLSREQTA